MIKTALPFILLLICTLTFAQKPYKGAEVFSKDKVLYGKFEMNMKMIKGSGMLSTFYTIEQGDNDYWAELDIEVLGKDNAQVMSTNIFTDNESGGLDQSVEEIHVDYSLADTFHTFTLEWTPDYIAWFIDGVEHRRETGDVVNHMTVPQGYRFNSWVSCSPGWVGDIDRDAMPSYQYVEWLEYSSYDTATQEFTLEWRDDFDNFNSSRWAKAEWTFYCNEVDFAKENAFIEDGRLVLAITDPSAPSSILEEPIQDYFTTRYNAASDEILVNSLENGKYKIQLFDTSGKLVIAKQTDQSYFSISCSNIQSGLYIISINHNGKWFSQKIFVN
ncbi:family 16 glycosylhydrolase [Portibacter lacus]|uniref:Beta-glucanase n=1 Tax=Portibacter lacus TaxID=1099794 RepID=A0AA37WE85_9BACT|nr:family 16 glycosylhydrolase [Portibacter lacus]GLR16812.1 hypothetical protein GCM10007940_14270 [Portibacter lacus]